MGDIGKMSIIKISLSNTFNRLKVLGTPQNSNRVKRKKKTINYKPTFSQEFRKIFKLPSNGLTWKNDIQCDAIMICTTISGYVLTLRQICQIHVLQPLLLLLVLVVLLSHFLCKMCPTNPMPEETANVTCVPWMYAFQMSKPITISFCSFPFFSQCNSVCEIVCVHVRAPLFPL